MAIQRKAYRISKPNLRRNGIPEDSAVGTWIVNFGVIGRDDLHTIRVDESSIKLESMRAMIAESPIPDWDHDQPAVAHDQVALYDYFAASPYYDQGWAEINDSDHPVAYDQSGICPM